MTTGRFVPICTQMVFNKSFKSQDVNLREWSDADKDRYEAFIISQLSSFYNIDSASITNPGLFDVK